LSFLVKFSILQVHPAPFKFFTFQQPTVTTTMSAATDSDCPLHKGQLFDSFDDFKFTLDDWAVQAKFSYRAKKK
jgi:hypothetical protein